MERKQKGIFRAILEDEYKKPVIDVVQSKRKRFSLLLRAVAKNLYQDNWEKTWRLCSHMIIILQEAEYPDEYVECCSLDEIIIYLHVVYASCGAQINKNVEGCLTICHTYIKYCQVYPILYPTMIICHLKLGQYDTAKDVIKEGIEFINTDFDLIMPRKYNEVREDTLEYVQNLGHNSPKYIMFLFYAYGKLLDMQIEDNVNQFMKQRSLTKDFEYFKIIIKNNHFRCCTGSSIETLNRLRRKITMQNIYVDSDFSELKITSRHKNRHVLNHCNIKYIAVNDLVTNHIVTAFNEVNSSPQLSNVPPNYCVTYKITSLVRQFKGLPKRKAFWIIGKPRQTRFSKCLHHLQCTKRQDTGMMKRKDLKIMFRVKVLPQMFIIIKNIRTNIIEELYLQLLDLRMNACKIFDGLEDVLAHMIYIYNEFAVPLAKGTVFQIWTFAEPIIERIRLCVLQLKLYIDRYETVAGGNNMFNNLFAIEMKHIEGLALAMRAQLRRFSFCVYLKMQQMVSQYKPDFELQRHTNKSIRDWIENTENPLFKFKFNNAVVCECRACFFSYQVYLKRDSKITRFVQIIPAVDRAQGKVIQMQKSAPKTCSRETQTKYNKFSCSSKQTQTEKRLSEEYALKKQIQTLNTNRNDLMNKICELEDSVYELSESKKEILENENKMIKSLKKELAEARRIMHDKTKEVEQQKDQIEQLKANLSKFNKPYSHAVKTPEEVQQKNGNLMKQNEKLQIANTNVINENKSLRKHLSELTDEYDKLKVKCDELVEFNEKKEIVYQKKSVDYEDLICKFQSFKLETGDKLKKEQTKIIEIRALIHTSMKDLVDFFIEKINQYKIRCQRLHHELLCHFFNSSAQYSIKQTYETNQIFLATTAGQLERNIHFLASFKAKLSEDPLINFITMLNCLNWKTTLTYTEEFCSGVFNQYVQNLNTLITLNTVLDHSRFANASPVIEPEKLYRQPQFNQHAINNPPTHQYESIPMPESPRQGPGPVGANRPQSLTTEYQKAQAQSPIEIEDPNAKNILSQIANAVNYPSSMSPTYSMDPSQGVVRRPIASRHQIAESERAATPDNLQWNQNVPVPSMPLDCSDFNCYNGKYRDIFLMVQRRLPCALMGDLIDALNLVKTAYNNNLYKVSHDTITEMVSRYIAKHSKNRMRPDDTKEMAKQECNTDEVCSICFEKMISLPTYTLKCCHVFHSKCIRSWIKRNNICPICRKFTILD